MTTIQYTLAKGSVEIRLAGKDDVATLDATVRGMAVAPRVVQVIDGASATGVSRCFKQAHGMGGGSGLVDLQRGKPVESFGIAALLGTGPDALVIFAQDHTRFEQVYDTRKLSLCRTVFIAPHIRF